MRMEALHGTRLASSGASARYRQGWIAARSSRVPLVSSNNRAPTLLLRRRGRRGRRGRLVVALDAAQVYDYEARRMQQIQDDSRLKIGILGFGNFGQFLAKRFVEQGHHVLAHSRSDYSSAAQALGVSYFRDADDFAEEHPEIVLLCTSILSTEAVLRSLPLQRFKRNTLFVDVLSVKEFPKNLFLQILPDECDVLCTHPMFGPESGMNSWNSLPFVYEKVRVRRPEACTKFLEVFEREGCRMVEMSCEEHDRFAASSQFITHTVGRMLGKLGLQSTPINTKGYETLLNLVKNTEGDSFDLYYGLFMYNINATEELERLELAFDSLKKQLFGQLHDVLRKQLFSGAEQSNGAVATTSSSGSSSKGTGNNHSLGGRKQLSLPALPAPVEEPETGGGSNASLISA